MRKMLVSIESIDVLDDRRLNSISVDQPHLNRVATTPPGYSSGAVVTLHEPHAVHRIFLPNL